MKNRPFPILLAVLGIFLGLGLTLQPASPAPASPAVPLDNPCDDDEPDEEACDGPQACPCSHGEDDKNEANFPAGCIATWDVDPTGHNGCCVSPQCTTTNEGCWFEINVSATKGESCSMIGPFWKISLSSSVTLPEPTTEAAVPDGWCSSTGVKKKLDCGTIPPASLHVIVGCKGEDCSPEGEPAKFKFYVLRRWELECGACATTGGGGS